MTKIAFIGLGVMGYPMAAHLSKQAGNHITVFNRTRKRAEQWVSENSGDLAETPALAAKDKDFVFSCVGNDNDLREVTLGENGSFSTMKAGAIFIDHTTASAEIARQLDTEARHRNFSFLDAPVSGGQSGAENGTLSIMCGGDQTIFDRAMPIMQAYGKSIGLMGPSGAGQLTKMVNQICIAGLVQGLAEGIHFAKRAGLDVEQVMSVIAGGAAGSWQLQNRHSTMDQGKYDFGFAVDWMRKDFAICLEEAQRNGARLDVVKLVDSFYKDVQDMGGGRWDTSSLLARLEKPEVK